MWLRCTVQLIPYLGVIFPRMGGYIPTWSETLCAQCGERRRCCHLRKPFSEHIIYVTKREDESRTAPVYLYRAGTLSCQLSRSAYQNHGQLVTESRLFMDGMYPISGFFFCHRGQELSIVRCTGTCAHGNNQFATNIACQASRRWRIRRCRCAPSEYYGMFLVTEPAPKAN